MLMKFKQYPPYPIMKILEHYYTLCKCKLILQWKRDEENGNKQNAGFKLTRKVHLL